MYCENRSINSYVISHASEIYVPIPPNPIHHCELFDHLPKNTVLDFNLIFYMHIPDRSPQTNRLLEMSGVKV